MRQKENNGRLIPAKPAETNWRQARFGTARLTLKTLAGAYAQNR